MVLLPRCLPPLTSVTGVSGSADTSGTARDGRFLTVAKRSFRKLWLPSARCGSGQHFALSCGGVSTLHLAEISKTRFHTGFHAVEF